MPEHLSEPPAVRVTGPDWGTMSFAAFGANLFIGVSPYWIGSNLRAPPTLIYSTETSALTVGPRLPDDHVCDLDDAVAAGGRLFAMSSVYDKDSDKTSYFWQILEPTGDEDLWDPSRAWWWWSEPAPPLMQRVETIVCHAKHPDGRTIFLSTGSKRTYAFDTGNCECRELGDWVLPFTGQAHYDPEFDALVGLHAEEDGCVCLCPVPSRSSAARQPPECTMLREKLCCYIPKDHDRRDGWSSIKGTTSLTYIGDSRYCLVEHVPCGQHVCVDGTVVHITLFGLKYGSRGELQTKVHRTTRSYAVSKNQVRRFSHAIFCL